MMIRCCMMFIARKVKEHVLSPVKIIVSMLPGNTANTSIIISLLKSSLVDTTAVYNPSQ